MTYLDPTPPFLTRQRLRARTQRRRARYALAALLARAARRLDPLPWDGPSTLPGTVERGHTRPEPNPNPGRVHYL